MLAVYKCLGVLTRVHVAFANVKIQIPLKDKDMVSTISSSTSHSLKYNPECCLTIM